MLSLLEQVRIYEEVCDTAFDDMLIEMQERKLEIIDLGRERLIDGFEEYGDDMWEWDDRTRDAEWMQEAADAVVYKVSEHG